MCFPLAAAALLLYKSAVRQEGELCSGTGRVSTGPLQPRSYGADAILSGARRHAVQDLIPPLLRRQRHRLSEGSGGMMHIILYSSIAAVCLEETGDTPLSLQHPSLLCRHQYREPSCCVCCRAKNMKLLVKEILV